MKQMPAHEIRVRTVIDVNDLAQNISDELDHDELLEFVKILDLHTQDWNFTLQLIEYFEQQKKIYEEEVNGG